MTSSRKGSWLTRFPCNHPTKHSTIEPHTIKRVGFRYYGMYMKYDTRNPFRSPWYWVFLVVVMLVAAFLL